MHRLAKALLPQQDGQDCPVVPGSLPQLDVAWCFDTGVWWSSSSVEFLVFVYKIFHLPLCVESEAGGKRKQLGMVWVDTLLCFERLCSNVNSVGSSLLPA